MPVRKLGRKTDHRLSMLRGQVTFLLEKGSLETTATRAKEVKRLADKMITVGKKNTLAAKRQALAFITKEDVVKKLFDEIAPVYEGRSGGYTRINLLGPRRGDAAEMALIELVPTKEEKKEEKKSAKKTASKKAPAKKTTAKKAAEKAEEKVEEKTEEAKAEVEAAAEDAVKAVEEKAEEVKAEAEEKVEEVKEAAEAPAEEAAPAEPKAE